MPIHLEFGKHVFMQEKSAYYMHTVISVFTLGFNGTHMFGRLDS